MLRSQANNSCALFGSDPNRANAAEKSERVVADDLSRALQGKFNGRIGERLYRAKLIGHFQDNSSHVNAVADQFVIVGLNQELSIHALRRHSSLDDLFAVDIAFNAQILPAPANAA